MAQENAARLRASLLGAHVTPVYQPVSSGTFMQQVGADFKVALITGDYGQDATWGSSSYSIAAAIAGVDIVADINSFKSAIENHDYGSAAFYTNTWFKKNA